jgi:type II secretion system protein J
MKKSHGFTLLELILALALVAMLAGTLYESMTVAFKAKSSAEAAVTPARTCAIVSDLIAQDLQSCLPPKSNPTNNPNILAGPFEGTQQGGGGGEADDLQFYCVGSDSPDNDQQFAEGVRLVELTIDTSITPQALVRKVTRNLLSSTQETPDEEILCRGVQSFAVQYFDGSQWQTSWDSTQQNNTLPVAVQLTLQLSPDPNAPAGTAGYQITRTIPLACGVSVNSTSTSTSGGGN